MHAYLRAYALLVLLQTFTSARPEGFLGTNLARNESILLFDAPSYQTSTCPIQHSITVDAYAYTNSSVDEVAAVFETFLTSSGVDIGEKGQDILRSRVRWFATSPLGGKTVQIRLDGCSRGVHIGETVPAIRGTNTAGMAENERNAGSCDHSRTATGRAVLRKGDHRSFTTTVYKSGTRGWGVISGMIWLGYCEGM
jgi:hypothetical protein